MSRFGISKKATENAEAQLSFNLKVPDDAETKVNKGETEYRWIENVVVKKAFNTDKAIKDSKGEETNEFRTEFSIQLQVRPGSENKGKTVFGRHLVNYTALAEESDKDSWLNAMSINVLKTLVRALDYTMDNGEIPGEALEEIFPDKDDNGTSSAEGIRLQIQVSDKPRLDKVTKKPTGERQQQIEAYFPEAK